MSDLLQTTKPQQSTQLPDIVALEREKLALEREKLEVEKTRAKWTAISVVVTLLAAIFTVAFGLWTNHQQAKRQFEAKVAEIVMQSGSPDEALGRAQTFMAMFPDRLPKDFVKAFDPTEFTNQEMGVPETKKEFLKLLADKGLTKEEIVKVWKHLFPDDNWMKDFSFESVLSNNGALPNKSGEKDAPKAAHPTP
jgi:hypothetical protein